MASGYVYVYLNVLLRPLLSLKITSYTGLISAAEQEYKAIKTIFINTRWFACILHKKRYWMMMMMLDSP